MISVIAAILLSFVLIGFLVSLRVVIPQVRAELSSNKTSRTCAAALLGTASLIVSSVLFARFIAGLNYTGQTLGYDPWFEPHKGILANSDAIVEELWLRDIVPPPLQRECFSSKPTICKYADELGIGPSRRAGRSWGSYFGHYSMSVIAFLTSSLTVLILTRKRLRQKPANGVC
jgi:hypothetical protein